MSSHHHAIGEYSYTEIVSIMENAQSICKFYQVREYPKKYVNENY
ncbi:MAG: hypothetical protein ACOZBL_04210 [Patescibacteria group bacterium]